MAGTVRIRPAEASDAADLAGLMTELGYPSTPDQMAGRLAATAGRHDHAVLVAAEGDQVVGMVGATVWPGYHADAPTGWIVGLVVAEARRGRGIGRQLVAAAEAWMRGAGAARAGVTSHVRRAEAHAFYQGLGYEQTGLRFVRELDNGG